MFSVVDKNGEVGYTPRSMYKQQGGRRSGGKSFGNRAGGKAPWKRDSRGFNDRSFNDKPSFTATCAECGDSCTVPFKPNGKKPVLCSNCFGGNTKSHDKPFQKKGPYKPAGFSGGSSDVDAQLKAINAKLDRIILAIEESDLN